MATKHQEEIFRQRLIKRVLDAKNKGAIILFNSKSNNRSNSGWIDMTSLVSENFMKYAQRLDFKIIRPQVKHLVLK